MVVAYTNGIRPEDLQESADAAAFLISYLDGERVDPTKPRDNEAHQFRPIHIKLDVNIKSSHEGGILQLFIKQADIHHPDLVRDMLIKRFAALPETAPYPLTHSDIDYNVADASFVVNLKLPSGKADDIIHALALRADEAKRAPASPSWAKRVGPQAATTYIDEPPEERWTTKILNFLGLSHNRSC